MWTAPQLQQPVRVVGVAFVVALRPANVLSARPTRSILIRAPELTHAELIVADRYVITRCDLSRTAQLYLATLSTERLVCELHGEGSCPAARCTIGEILKPMGFLTRKLCVVGCYRPYLLKRHVAINNVGKISPTLRHVEHQAPSPRTCCRGCGGDAFLRLLPVVVGYPAAYRHRKPSASRAGAVRRLSDACARGAYKRFRIRSGPVVHFQPSKHFIRRRFAT